MKKITFILTGLSFILAAKAQQHAAQSRQTNDTTIYTAVEHDPVPPGGMGKFQSYFVKSIRPTKPFDPLNSHLAIEMIVEKDGSISHIKILKSMSKEIDAQAIKALNESSRWKPGLIKNKPVRVKYILPLIIDWAEDEK